MSSDERKKIIAERFFDLANIEAGVIVFSELAGRGEVRIGLVLLGFILFVVLYAVGYLLLTKENL